MNLPKTYEPKLYEADIYSLWEKSGAFQPSGEGEPYSIIMPPPNANGDLHIGHVLGNTVQDILVRFYRMQGRRTILIPGADHAGFETWVVYEKQLEKEGKSRFDYSRDELYKQTWDFVARHRGSMEQQFRLLGTSCDWNNLAFTLDPNVVAVTYRTFEKMWQDGLIYRGERIVNFCTTHQTSFADIEVVYKEEKSKLWTIAFPLADGSGAIEIATTRPETMVGDVAVAVNPKDSRYTSLIGKMVALPLTDRQIPIIADEMVDVDFGTGAVKITPAHDPNDAEVVERHPELPKLNVIGGDGLMTEHAPEKYVGLPVLEAREAILDDLEKLNLVKAVTPHTHSVGHCYKCGSVIQPLLKDQWFISVKPLAGRAIRSIKHGEIQFTPRSKARVLINYLEGLRDWNISRQIPWGIPVPAFQNVQNPGDWIFDTRVEEEFIEVDGKKYKRDSDTFDTWFSSGQWPFITTLFAQNGGLEEFYPNAVMETAGDILFQWVSRMIMLGLYVTDQVPFSEVYLHGLVLDEKGQKFSKSKGNGISPQVIVDAYGADATRLGLVAARSAGQNQAFGSDKVIAGRNFCNKLWNIARFIEAQLGDQLSGGVVPVPVTPADHWIVGELLLAKQTVGTLIAEYRFSEAYETVYHVVWDKVADWYIEASKAALTSPETAKMLSWVLECCLILAHPFAPFVTETIWQTLQWHDEEDDLLITTAWHYDGDFDEQKAKEFEELQKVITEIREICSTINLREATLLAQKNGHAAQNETLVTKLTPVKTVTVSKKPNGLRLTHSAEALWLDLDENQIQKYKNTLQTKLHDLEEKAAHLTKRLNNSSYVKNAPKELVAATKEEKEVVSAQAKQLTSQLKNI